MSDSEKNSQDLGSDDRPAPMAPADQVDDLPTKPDPELRLLLSEQEHRRCETIVREQDG